MDKLEVHETDNPEELDLEEPELEEGEEDSDAEMIEALDRLGMVLSGHRSDAIEFRSTSGIETIWIEDRESYEGIDDANRGEMGSWGSKPPGRGVLGGEGDDDEGSTVFFNITSSYCDLASARVGDMLLPTDDKGWAIDPTPIPEMIAIAGGEIPYKIEQQIRSQVPEEQVDGVMADVIANEKMISEDARATADRASKRIEDWHVECQYNAEMRMVIDDASIIGTGVLKGPIPENRKHIAYKDNQLIIQDEIQPVSRRVEVGNCYPDPACGSNIQNGSRHHERDDLSRKSLEDLREQDGYINDQIDACLAEGPFAATKTQKELENGEQSGLKRREKDKLFEIWYIYCRLSKEDISAAGLDADDDDEDTDAIDVHVVMVNNRVIRASVNHLDGGDFPYDYMCWIKRAAMPFGIGISRQIRIPQRIINGAGRNLMDNAGMAGGPMWIVNQGLVEPIDERYEIRPRKGWFASEDAETLSDVRNAFTFIDMPMMQEDLQAIIKMGMEFAEQISGLPSLLQGHEQQNEETLGGQQARRNDGSTLLRRVARNYDDDMTTPHVRRYYQWLLIYGEDNEKGDFVINARGSTALIERDLHNQSIMDMASLVLNPVYGLDPVKWIEEYLKSQKLDPKNFKYDDEEWKEIVANMSAPPPDSSIEVANIRAQTVLQTDQNKTEIALGTMQNDNDQAERDRQLTMQVKSAEQQLDLLELQMKQAGDKDEGLDKIKADLTKTIMTLKTQVALNGSEVATPVVEPKGKAEDGKSFQQ